MTVVRPELLAKRTSAALIALLAAFWPFTVLAPTPARAVYEGRSAAVVTTEPEYQGVHAIVDLPASQHVKNRAARNLGCCVFASMDMDARWHNFRPLIGVIDKIEIGGGWPEKVDDVIRQNAPGFHDYVQYSGPADPSILDQAMAEGRGACVTYGYSERYAPLDKIQHMVLLIHLDQELACILDNNFPGTYEWMSREEFLYRWKYPNPEAWAYVFLLPGPPPSPSN